MQARAEQTRRVILKAAAETFEVRGYVGTSLQDIVTGREVSKGALYFHFSTKEELAVTILTEQLDLWRRLLTELQSQDPRAIRVLPELLWRVIRTLRDNVMVRAGTRLATEGDLIGESAPMLFCDWADVVEELLDEASDQGDLRPDVDTRVVAELVVATIAGLQRMTALRRGDTDLREHVMAMWRLLLQGLIKPERVAEVTRDIEAPGDPSRAAGRALDHHAGSAANGHVQPETRP